jgi:hypothetical protein
LPSIGKKVDLPLCLKALRHDDIWGAGGRNSAILDHGTRWRWVVSFTPLALCLKWKSSRYLLGRRLVEPQSRSARCGEEESIDLTGNLTSPSLYWSN